METNQTSITTASTTMKKRQPRKRPLPPDVTCRNLAIEKRRRQDMNLLFLDLARCLPRLASTKRLSKNLIVMESLQHLRRQRDMCIAAGRELRELLSEHHGLIAEVNILRSQLQIPVRNAPRPPSTALLFIMDVENQTYGEFPNGFVHPSATENHEPQPSARQREWDVLLPGPPTAPDLVPPVHTSTQDWQLNSLDGAGDVVSQELWQAQTPEHLFSSSNVHGALVPDAEWWEFNDVSELNSELPDILPWEGTCNDVLQGYSQSIFVPPPRLYS